MERPKLPNMPSKTPAYEEFETICEEYMDAVEQGLEDRSSNLSHKVFEASMELVYGPDVWAWVNAQVKR